MAKQTHWQYSNDLEHTGARPGWALGDSQAAAPLLSAFDLCGPLRFWGSHPHLHELRLGHVSQ